MGKSPNSIEREQSSNPYWAARRRLTEFLIRTTLIESYHSFVRHGKPYPFLSPAALQPGAMAPSAEHPFQRGALILLVNGLLPRTLRKHIRCRRNNEMTPTNLLRLAPDIGPAKFSPSDLKTNSDSLEMLLELLIGVDYCLLFQRDIGSSDLLPYLSHIHVKVERLTDNAVRELALSLGYVKRRLYESGEMFAERLEGKYHEYFGFSPNASGRKTAAAMAAQLLARTGQTFAVFTTSQEDCRLTVLDNSDEILHYVLVELASDAIPTEMSGFEQRYAIDIPCTTYDLPRRVMILCVRQRRTQLALPIGESDIPRGEGGLDRPWLKLVEKTIVPLPGQTGPSVPILWSTNN